jgi:RNA polymerase sigma factor (sigma-70 family)
MAATPVDSLLRYLDALAERRSTEGLADGELLRRFATRGDESSFAALVRRHGPFVLQVCRRLLADPHTAEDVFQATFLVLARRANFLRKPEAVGSFLYGVAYRLARRARVESARRRLHERRHLTPPPADPLAEVSGRELFAVLEDELNALPWKYRLPLELCCMQGRTRDEAARQAGWSLRTLQRRLEQGRSLLRNRLTRRGLAFTGLLPGTLLAPPAAEALPTTVLTHTVRAAVAFTSRSAGVVGLPSERAAALAGGMLRVMYVTRLKVASSLLLALTILITGMYTLAPSSAGQPVETRVETRSEAPAAQPKADSKPPTRPVVDAEMERVIRTDDAIATGLQWLVRQQARDGRWSLDGNNRNDVAATAFALLPLVEAGETPKSAGALHPYSWSVEKGLKYLLTKQSVEGSFAGDMYANALATRAVCEAYHRTKDPALKASAQRALGFIVQAQHEGGGWRYAPKQPGDTSVTSYQLAALVSGRRAGLAVPEQTLTLAGKFLDSVMSADGSGYAYYPGGPSTPTMSAAGHLCRLELGGKRDDQGLAQWAASLRRLDLAKAENEGYSRVYYQYYVTRALWLRGGDDWNSWEKKALASILDQQDHGENAEKRGSWPPYPTVGRLMTTSLAVLTLQLYAQRDPSPRLPARELSPREITALYGTLGDEDFVKARRAMRLLMSSPRDSVAFLRMSLRPVAPVDARRIDRLIDDLENDKFAVREKATAELEKLGELAHPVLRKRLTSNPSLEVRRRIEQVLEATESRTRTPELRRSLRAVEVLVVAASPEAHELLKGLASGAPEAPLTQAAKAGLQRLDKRTEP